MLKKNDPISVVEYIFFKFNHEKTQSVSTYFFQCLNKIDGRHSRCWRVAQGAVEDFLLSNRDLFTIRTSVDTTQLLSKTRSLSSGGKMPEPARKSAGRAGSHAAQRGGKTIEEIFQKKTPLEHILLRPDTYVGSTEPQMTEMWVFDEVSNALEYRRIK